MARASHGRGAKPTAGWSMASTATEEASPHGHPEERRRDHTLGGRSDRAARACTALSQALSHARRTRASTSASHPSSPRPTGAGAVSPSTIPTSSRRLALLRLEPRELPDAWRQAEHEASITLTRCRDADDGAKEHAQAGSRAALDREAHAADVARRRVELPGARCGYRGISCAGDKPRRSTRLPAMTDRFHHLDASARRRFVHWEARWTPPPNSSPGGSPCQPTVVTCSHASAR